MSEIKVLLLRGVNVAGANRLPMPEFRQMLMEQGVSEVRTHIQSGNAVFLDPGVPDLAGKITAAMKDRFGFAPPMIMMSLKQFDAIQAANPFAQQGAVDGTKVHFMFLAEPVSAAELSGISAHATGGEMVKQSDAALYLLLPNGFGRSVLAEKLERLLNVQKTARNQTSVAAISALARTIAV